MGWVKTLSEGSGHRSGPASSERAPRSAAGARDSPAIGSAGLANRAEDLSLDLVRRLSEQMCWPWRARADPDGKAIDSRSKMNQALFTSNININIIIIIIIIITNRNCGC